MTPPEEISEATQQHWQKVTQWDPNMLHTPSQKEKTAEKQEQVEEVLRSLGRSPKEQKKYSRNRTKRQRQRDFAGRVHWQRAEAETAVGPVASLCQSDEEEEDSVPADSDSEPVESQGRPAASGCRTESRG